jgi:hypothetical protein
MIFTYFIIQIILKRGKLKSIKENTFEFFHIRNTIDEDSFFLFQ